MLNEDEHHIQPENGPAYTACYDAIKVEVAKVNPKIVLVGPEIVGGGWSWPYMRYFLDKDNHDTANDTSQKKLKPPLAGRLQHLLRAPHNRAEDRKESPQS